MADERAVMFGPVCPVIEQGDELWNVEIGDVAGEPAMAGMSAVRVQLVGKHAEFVMGVLPLAVVMAPTQDDAIKASVGRLHAYARYLDKLAGGAREFAGAIEKLAEEGGVDKCIVQ